MARWSTSSDENCVVVVAAYLMLPFYAALPVSTIDWQRAAEAQALSELRTKLNKQ